jgi:hypothetical protein
MAAGERERAEFLAWAETVGMGQETALLLLRYSATLHRLAEAQCNGDYPYHVDRENVHEGLIATCPQCESRLTWRALKKHPRLYPGTGQKVCPDCYTTQRAKDAVPAAWIPVFQGDPRGYPLRLFPAGTPTTDIESGRASGVGVPC